MLPPVCVRSRTGRHPWLVPLSATEDLFGFMREDIRQAKLMLTVNDVNETYGKYTVAPASTLPIRKASNDRIRFQYPLLKAH